MRDEDRVEARTLGVALLASLLLWNLPGGSYAVYPFKLLATWLHEMTHGLAMMITGAGLDRVLVYRDTSGLAYAQTSVDAIGSAAIAASGYMGTALWGALLLVVTPDARRARWALIVLAVLLGLTAITVVAPANGDTFGQWAVAGMGVAIAACALLPARWRLLVAHFIAAQSCINALLDIRVLLRPSQVVNGISVTISDAHQMASMTFGTTETWAVWTWAIAWLVWSLVVLYVALRLMNRRHRRA